MHSLFETTQTLFWAVFGLVDLESFELDGIKAFTRFWGMLMFGTYSVINIVVLLNLLIAMMNHSYQLISVSVATFNLSLLHGHDRANSFFLSSLPSSPQKRNAPTSSGSSPGASFGSATSRRVARSHPRSTSSPPRRACGTWVNGCIGNCAGTAERRRRST